MMMIGKIVKKNRNKMSKKKLKKIVMIILWRMKNLMMKWLKMPWLNLQNVNNKIQNQARNQKLKIKFLQKKLIIYQMNIQV